MDTSLLRIVIAAETDIVPVTARTPPVGRVDRVRRAGPDTDHHRGLGDRPQCLRVRGGGYIEFRMTGEPPTQSFVIVARDRGPGIADLQAVLAGSHKSVTGMGIGLLGARRLMDTFDIASKPGQGTTVLAGQDAAAPRGTHHPGAAGADHGCAGGGWSGRRDGGNRTAEPGSASARRAAARQEDLQRLNRELEDTNRGVVALYAELDERADHLRRADEVKTRFLSNMTHEFRTPLNSMLALTRLLLDHMDGDLTPEQETQVHFIRKAAENLSELVNDLLDLAKVEAGKIVVRAVEFEVRNRVRCAARHAAAAADRARRSTWCSMSPRTFRRSTPTKARSRRFYATSSRTR